MHRSFYIVAYDISDPGRLQKALALLKSYSTGGQKSVFECFLTSGERGDLQRRLLSILDTEEDRAHLFQMDDRCVVATLGVALKPKDPAFFYFG